MTEGFTRCTMSANPIGCAALLKSLLTCAWAGLTRMPTPPGKESKPQTAAPRPATTEAISAILRAENIERRARR
jgi:hypothetical protein